MQLAAAEERQAATETEVRDEVSAEMGELLRDMEAGYRVSGWDGLECSLVGIMKCTSSCATKMQGKVSSSAIWAVIAWSHEVTICLRPEKQWCQSQQHIGRQRATLQRKVRRHPAGFTLGYEKSGTIVSSCPCCAEPRLLCNV